MPPQSALTFDIEDYFQVQAFADVVDRAEWPRFTPRVEDSTLRLLKLLERHNVKATFFILGWLAERHPALVREIASRGHEIASHGYWHRLIYTQSPEEFAEDLRLAEEAIRAACPGAELLGYRAPCFSITGDSRWALDVLQQRGYRYDSSVFPITGHDTYGIGTAPRFASYVRPQLLEIPLTTLECLGKRWPIAGGGYLRLYPLWLTRRGIRQVNRLGQPAVVYLHPWDCDPDQPRMPGISLKSRFRHYVFLGKTFGRLDQLLQEFEFGPLREVFAPQLEEIDKAVAATNSAVR